MTLALSQGLLKIPLQAVGLGKRNCASRPDLLVLWAGLVRRARVGGVTDRYRPSLI